MGRMSTVGFDRSRSRRDSVKRLTAPVPTTFNCPELNGDDGPAFSHNFEVPILFRHGREAVKKVAMSRKRGERRPGR
jgi:hypothetical protein